MGYVTGLIGFMVFFAVVGVWIYWKEIKSEKVYHKKQTEEIKSKKLKEIEANIQESLRQLENISKEIEQKEVFNSSLLKIREEELENLLKEKQENRKKEISSEIKEWAKSMQEAANYEARFVAKGHEQDIEKIKKDRQTLQKEVEAFRARRDAINQEILRERAIEEKQDFFCVQIPESYKRDIAVLNSIRPQITKIDILDKLIYNNYIKNSVNEMTKRVLEGRSPCGVYKITRLKTGEVYIGKSTNIKLRWQQHCKSSYHCGTISHSTLHSTMEKDGLWNFTFEVLEEVPREKLSEVESYWIKIYDSKSYGMNERIG